MLRSVLYESTGFLLLSLLVGWKASSAQPTSPAVPTSEVARVSLADVVRTLPEYVKPGRQVSYSQAFENATGPERDAAVPNLIAWLKDDQPDVRRLALLLLGVLYMPPDKDPEPLCTRFLPAQYVPVVAASLKDPNAKVRSVAFLALQSVESCGHGMDELVVLVVPMLRDPDVLAEYPDPFFVESDKQILARMTPEQQANFKAQHRPVIKMPAEGPALLSILAVPTRTPSIAVDDAMIAFLDRKDQTKSTLGDCLHNLALSRASERVNDEALRRVFEQKAMTVFLLQFVAQIKLTPEQLSIQQERLIALSNDESEHPALRKSAKTVAACWNGDRTAPCQPTSEEFYEEGNTR